MFLSVNRSGLDFKSWESGIEERIIIIIIITLSDVGRASRDVSIRTW